jgi:peptidoglycan/LPS O-acetylase OafA/YrhL
LFSLIEYDRRMTRDLDSGESRIEVRRRRTFRIRIWAGAGCYLLASFALYQWGHGTSPWRIAWAVLPLLFMVWIVIVIVLRVRQMDEYQVKLLFPGLAVGFTVAICAALTMGTLSAAGFGLPNTGWIVAVAGLVAWEFTNLLVHAPTA